MRKKKYANTKANANAKRFRLQENVTSVNKMIVRSFINMDCRVYKWEASFITMPSCSANHHVPLIIGTQHIIRQEEVAPYQQIIVSLYVLFTSLGIVLKETFARFFFCVQNKI